MSETAEQRRTRKARNTADWRAAHPDQVAKANGRSAARSAAMEELARRHPEEFGELFSQRLAATGWEPPETTRPCPCGGTITRKSPLGRWPARCGQCPGF